MKERITILVGKDWDGFTFRLPPKAKQLVKDLQPITKSLGKAKEPEPLMSQVSISFDEKTKLESLGGPVYKYIVEMLTGMTLEKINSFGGVVFADAETEKVIHDTKKGEDAASA